MTTRFMHGRVVFLCMDSRILKMPGRSTLSFHQPGRHPTHQTRSAVTCSQRVTESVSCVLLEKTSYEADFGTVRTFLYVDNRFENVVCSRNVRAYTCHTNMIKRAAAAVCTFRLFNIHQQSFLSTFPTFPCTLNHAAYAAVAAAAAAAASSRSSSSVFSAFIPRLETNKRFRHSICAPTTASRFRKARCHYGTTHHCITHLTRQGHWVNMFAIQVPDWACVSMACVYVSISY